MSELASVLTGFSVFGPLSSHLSHSSASKMISYAYTNLARGPAYLGAVIFCWCGALSTCSLWGLAWRSGARIRGLGNMWIKSWKT